MTILTRVFLSVLIPILLLGCGTTARRADQPAVSSSMTYTEIPLKGKPFEATCADFNGDGLDDLAVAVKYSGTYVFYNNPRHDFTDYKKFTGFHHGISIKHADLNGDGNMDLVVLIEDMVHFYLGDGKGNFVLSEKNYTGPRMSRYVAVADLNNDGLPDLILGGSSDTHIFIYMNKGNLDFSFQEVELSPGKTPFKPSFSNISTGDFDGNSFTDILVPDHINGILWMLWNEGGGKFTPQIIFKTPQLSAAVAYRQKGSALPDVIVSAETKEGSLYYLKNNGDRSFTLSRTISVLPMPTHMVVADMDKDGIDDIVVTHLFSGEAMKGKISVLYGGDFSRQDSVTIGCLSVSSTVCDWNGDGYPEIFSPCYPSDILTYITLPH